MRKALHPVSLTPHPVHHALPEPPVSAINFRLNRRHHVFVVFKKST
ncbi:hypothetical protein [Burkholderia sp. LA-2-3-30-S1-D2]|nr:hypothetical protein [Burkholderia sp. LA-2-3-30-S1-D2]